MRRVRFGSESCQHDTKVCDVPPHEWESCTQQPTGTALLVCSNLYLPLHRAFNIGCIFTSRLLPLIMLRVAEQSLVVVIRVGREEERSMTVRYWN